VKSIADLVNLAKSKPGAVSYASAGAGTPTFMCAELFKSVAAVNMLHVPYRGGGEAITALVSGEAQVYFAPLSSGLPQVRSGRARALAVTSTKRLPMLSDLPAIAEAGYNYDAGFWYGLMVPAKTPKDVLTAVHQATITALKRPDAVKRLQDMIASPIGDEPDEFGAYVRAEIEKWGKIIRQTGITIN
jgi:tripartite-type tricarboxylate transporter receptor subunit TctC